MPNEVLIRQNRVVDFQDKFCSGVLTSGTVGTEILLTFADGKNFFTTQGGRRARLVFVGNNVDPGVENSVTFHVKANGNYLPQPFDAFGQSLGPTYDSQMRVAFPIELPQSACIQVTITTPAGLVISADYNVYARVRVEYEEF